MDIISKSKLRKKNAVKSVEFASGELRFQPLLRSPLKRLPDPLKPQWYHAFVSSDPSSVATVGLAPSKLVQIAGFITFVLLNSLYKKRHRQNIINEAFANLIKFAKGMVDSCMCLHISSAWRKVQKNWIEKLGTKSVLASATPQDD